jgi:hypothetical protein
MHVTYLFVVFRIRRIRMFLGLLDLDPDPSINKQKKIIKTLINDFFEAWFTVNVATERNKQNKQEKNRFCRHLGCH